MTPGEPPAPGVASDLEGALREYLPPGTSLPEARRAGVQGYDPAHDALFDGHPRLRRAVIEYRTGREAVRRFGALRFPPCTDPRAADARVAAGERIGPVGERAVFGVAREAMCRACRTWHLLLILEPPLPGTSADRLRAHRIARHCPACGAGDFHPHVEVLAPGTPS